MFKRKAKTPGEAGSRPLEADSGERQAVDREQIPEREGRPLREGRDPRDGEGRRPMSRTRGVGAAAVGTVGAGVVLVARLIFTLAVAIALLIGLAIVLRDVDANPQNAVVEGIHEGANFFAGAFTGLISFSGHPKRAITVNWGIALIVYLLVGSFVALMIRRMGQTGLRYQHTHRHAV